jgi:hypothetical protein
MVFFFLTHIGVSAAEITRKLRLLALTSLCAKSQSKDIKYADIAAGLDIPVKEVERWVIDGKYIIASTSSIQ